MSRQIKEYEQFVEHCGTLPIEQYFNLELITCSLLKSDFLIFTIAYGDVFKLELSITYNDDYPFSHPIWTILTINVEDPAIIDHYQQVISSHTNYYKTCWSPSILLEKDILYFIMHINHFDKVFKYPYQSTYKYAEIFKNDVTEELMMYVWHPSRESMWRHYDSDI